MDIEGFTYNVNPMGNSLTFLVAALCSIKLLRRGRFLVKDAIVLSGPPKLMPLEMRGFDYFGPEQTPEEKYAASGFTALNVIYDETEQLMFVSAKPNVQLGQFLIDVELLKNKVLNITWHNAMKVVIILPLEEMLLWTSVQGRKQILDFCWIDFDVSVYYDIINASRIKAVVNEFTPHLLIKRAEIVDL